MGIFGPGINIPEPQHWVGTVGYLIIPYMDVEMFDGVME
jgi:hypothetical protein